jgi:hypothetical protein
MRTPRLLLLLLATALGSAGALADVQKVGADGLVHRVEVEAVKGGGTQLRHFLTRNDGTTFNGVIPGTEDASPERDAVVEIDALTESPVVAWSRDGGTGWDIWISRFDNGAWAPPRRVLADAFHEIRPQLEVGAKLAHVVARSETGTRTDYVRVSVDRLTLLPAYGPESLPLDGFTLGADGEQDAASPVPPRGNAYFASDILRASATDPGKIVIWGVRDEPVPIDFRQVFLMPAGIRDPEQPAASWVEETLTVTVGSPARFWYTTRLLGKWTPMRGIGLDDRTSRADARTMVADTIRREREAAP